MGRYKGLFQAPANYEPLVRGPFDARELVNTKADLINPATWQQTDGSLWIYEGMQVMVKDEHRIYTLLNPISYFEESSWLKGAVYQDIVDQIGALPEGKTVVELIKNIEVGNYDDSALVEAIEEVKQETKNIDQDLKALQALVGATSVQEQIIEAINDLAPIAKSGNINDLTQNEGDYIVLGCGSSDELK